MGKENENQYPGVLPISKELKRVISVGVTVPWIITPFLAVVTSCQQPKEVEPKITPTLELVPIYTPIPKIEIVITPQPEATTIPEIEVILEPSAVSKEEQKAEIEVFRDLSKRYPEVWREFPSRIEKVIAYDVKEGPFEFSDLPAYQDYRIFGEYGMKERNLPLTKENLMFVLAWYELEYAQPIEQNPNFQRALKELAPAIKVVNEIIEDKVSAEEFVGEEIPQIPENLHRRLLFGNDNRGGRFFPEIYVIEEMKDPNPENYQSLLKYLAGVVPHELVHAWPQALFVGQGSSWSHEKDYEIKKGDTLWDISQEYGLKVEDILEINPQIENPDLIFPEQIVKIPQKGEFIWPENRKFHLVHMAMCSLTAPAQEKLGFDPGIEPRIVYIYSRLRENGVEDPYGLIVQAGATMNSDELWQIYEKVRGEGDLSLNELIATNDPDPDFSYYTSEELEAFRAEYASYLSPNDII